MPNELKAMIFTRVPMAVGELETTNYERVARGSENFDFSLGFFSFGGAGNHDSCNGSYARELKKQ